MCYFLIKIKYTKIPHRNITTAYKLSKQKNKNWNNQAKWKYFGGRNLWQAGSFFFLSRGAVRTLPFPHNHFDCCYYHLFPIHCWLLFSYFSAFFFSSFSPRMRNDSIWIFFFLESIQKAKHKTSSCESIFCQQTKKTESFNSDFKWPEFLRMSFQEIQFLVLLHILGGHLRKLMRRMSLTGKNFRKLCCFIFVPFWEILPFWRILKNFQSWSSKNWQKSQPRFLGDSLYCKICYQGH